MADPWQLPPSVYQGLGWSPDADPSTAPPAAGGPTSFGGLPLSIPQSMGWMPPDPAPDTVPPLPPQPTSLPSMQGQPAPPAAGGAAPDYQVPVSAFGAVPGGPPPATTGQPPAPRAAPAAPSKPQTFDQRMGALDQREAGTEQAQQQAITAGVESQKGLHADQLTAYRAADQTVAANAAARKAEQDQWEKIYATNAARTDADRQQIESWKFNRNSYMDSLGVGDKMRWGIAQILSNVGRALQRNTGPDPIAEMLQKNIHDANEAQFKERDALVQKLGIDRQSGMDAAQYHATRQAEIDKADGLAYTALGKQLEEAAVKSADPIMQANGLKASADVRSAADEKLKSTIQLRSQHDLQAQQNAISGGHRALAQKQFDWTKQKDQQELDLKAAALLAKKDGKLSEEESKRAIFIPGPDGTPIPATTKAGSVVLAADPGDAGKIRRQVASTSTYNALIGQMSRGIASHGGESDWWHSKDWQDMKTDYKAAVAELHEAYGVQSFREPTIEFFDSMTAAGLDPTAFNVIRSNATEALQNSNRNIQLKMNGLLGAQGYDGAPIAWANTSSPPPPTQTDEDRTVSDALVNPRRGFDTRPGKRATELGEFSARGPLANNETYDTRLAQEGGIVPSVRQAMNTWGAALLSPDMAIRRHYYEKLEKIKDDSESPETAAYAKLLLERALQRQMMEPTGEPETFHGPGGQRVQVGR